MTVLPITARVRNAILRVLADAAPDDLTTREVLDRLADSFGCRHAFRRAHDDPRHVPDYLPHGCNARPQTRCPHACWYTDAYPNLRALARQGCVGWESATYERREAHWRCISEPADGGTDAPADGGTNDPVGHCEVVDLDAPRAPRPTSARALVRR